MIDITHVFKCLGKQYYHENASIAEYFDCELVTHFGPFKKGQHLGLVQIFDNNRKDTFVFNENGDIIWSGYLPEKGVRVSLINETCSIYTFVINGIAANLEDFGIKKDINPGIAEDDNCGDLQFLPKPYTTMVLEKYGIDKSTYDEICTELKEKLSFGRCFRCTE